jgi:hypothetical protein
VKKNISTILAVTVLLCLATKDMHQAQAAGAYDYFNYLTSLPQAWKSYALRDQTQITSLLTNKYIPSWVNYDSTVDAAKVTIPEFASLALDPRNVTTTVSNISATDTQIKLQISGLSSPAGYVGGLANGSVLLIGDERVIVSRPSGSSWTDTVTVIRGSGAATHPAGTVVQLGINSLRNIPRLPLGTQDGHTYILTWDSLQTDSMHLSRTGNWYQKTFQLGFNGGRWFEVATRYNGTSSNNKVVTGFDSATDLASVSAKSYNITNGGPDWSTTDGNHSGPGITNAEALPHVGDFIIRPNVWVRYWLLVDQRANDYDYVSMWTADASTGPVQIFNRLPLSVPITGAKPNSLDTMWLEWNTSYNFVPEGRGDEVTYQRNFVALQDYGDPTPLLQKPGSEVVVLPPPLPPPPPPPTATLVGDINKDGIVNSLDWSVMNSKWLTNDANSDLNKDGIVNSIDYSMLNSNWFKTA